MFKVLLHYLQRVALKLVLYKINNFSNFFVDSSITT